MAFTLWFAASAVGVLLLLIGNFMLMSGANPFHGLFWLILALGIWFIVEARRTRGLPGVFTRWLWRGLIFAVLVPVALVGGFAFAVAAELDNAPAVMVLWALATFVVAEILASEAFVRHVPNETRQWMEENTLSPMRLRLTANAFSASMLTNLLLVLVLVSVAFNFPKEPPHQTAYPLDPPTAQQEQAYRELIRWGYKDTGEDAVKRIYGDLTDPSPGVAHPAPENQALRNQFGESARTAASYEKLTDAYFQYWDARPAPAQVTPELEAMLPDAAALLREYYRFLSKNEPVLALDNFSWNMPIGSFLMRRKAAQATAYLVLAEIELGQTDQAVADYLLWGDATRKQILNSRSLVQLMISVAITDLWINRLPDVLPHMTADDRQQLRALLEKYSTDFPEGQRRGWAGELAVFRTGMVQISEPETAPHHFFEVIQLHEVLTSSTSGDNPADKVANAVVTGLGLWKFLNRFALVFFDPHATARENEELQAPILDSIDEPFHQAYPRIQEFERDLEQMIGDSFYIRPRNPAGGMIMTVAIPSFLRANLRCAGVRSRLVMMRYALDAWDTPGQLPPAPIDETSDAPFTLTTAPDGTAVTIDFPATSPVHPVMSESALTIPLPQPVETAP